MRIIALIILLMTVPLASAKVYKWVDKDGNVHFTEQPPPEEVKAEEVDTSGSALRESQRQDAIRIEQQRNQAGDNQQMREDETSALRKQALEAEQDKHFQEQRKAACHSAKTNLQMLQSGGRIFELDEDGKRVYIKDSERKSRLVHFQGKVKEYCG
jgi:hypothetical protein